MITFYTYFIPFVRANIKNVFKREVSLKLEQEIKAIQKKKKN